MCGKLKLSLSAQCKTIVSTMILGIALSTGAAAAPDPFAYLAKNSVGFPDSSLHFDQSGYHGGPGGTFAWPSKPAPGFAFCGYRLWMDGDFNDPTTTENKSSLVSFQQYDSKPSTGHKISAQGGFLWVKRGGRLNVRWAYRYAATTQFANDRDRVEKCSKDDWEMDDRAYWSGEFVRPEVIRPKPGKILSQPCFNTSGGCESYPCPPESQPKNPGDTSCNEGPKP